jgi:hypothetical protein
MRRQSGTFDLRQCWFRVEGLRFLPKRVQKYIAWTREKCACGACGSPGDNRLWWLLGKVVLPERDELKDSIQASV